MKNATHLDVPKSLSSSSSAASSSLFTFKDTGAGSVGFEHVVYRATTSAPVAAASTTTASMSASTSTTVSIPASMPTSTRAPISGAAA